MDHKNCTNCHTIFKHFKIDQPSDLYKIAKQIQKAENEEKIEWCDGNCRVTEIQKDKPWPSDHIKSKYKCKICNSSFSLKCETYHGGRWQME